MGNIFEEKESQVRSYCRKYPVIFDKARNAYMYDVDGNRYIDFLAVAGSMNYGHNNPEIKKCVIEYLSDDNAINLMDMYSVAKKEFLETFTKRILEPRGLNYKVMCCGPTGTNGVEAAIKLARKNKKRSGIFAFGGAFHGMTLGSLALTTDRVSREGGFVSLDNVTHIPYEGTECIDSLSFIEWAINDDHSGIEKPSAIILETLQAEGGINVASIEWLKGIRKICTENDILMIVDDIQVGNGRTGHFFSFERAGIVPDMVVLSKSISGFGMPMALLLMKPELDIFRPAEHNGTFRGNQLSFVGGTAGINFYCNNNLDAEVERKARIVEMFIIEQILPIDQRLIYRGMGLIWGIDFSKIDSTLAIKCVHEAFEDKLICEVAGRDDSVLKIMPPLTIEDDVLMEGLFILKKIISRMIK